MELAGHSQVFWCTEEPCIVMGGRIPLRVGSPRRLEVYSEDLSAALTVGRCNDGGV